MTERLSSSLSVGKDFSNDSEEDIDNEEEEQEGATGRVVVEASPGFLSPDISSWPERSPAFFFLSLLCGLFLGLPGASYTLLKGGKFFIFSLTVRS